MRQFSYKLLLQLCATCLISLNVLSQSSLAPGLIAELGCAACHSGIDNTNLALRHAPDLSAAGQRYSPSYLLLYLLNPTAVQNDIGRSQMPDFRLSKKEAYALALYLASKVDPDQPQPDFPDTDQLRAARNQHATISADDGRELFVAMNCMGCHQMDSEQGWQEDMAPDLGDTGKRLNPGWLRSFLQNPQAVRPFGYLPGSGARHPDFRLNEQDAALLSTYLMNSRPLNTDNAALPQLSVYQRKKARSLLAEKLSCLGCHRIGDTGGKIGPDLSAAGLRLQPAFIEAMIRNPQKAVPGSIMPKIVMPEKQLQLIAAYLAEQREQDDSKYLSPLNHQSLIVELRHPQEQADYIRYCAPCHGKSGKGDGFNAAFLAVKPTVHDSSSYMSLRPDDTLYDGIFAGGYILNRSNAMPAFGASMSDQQITALVKHMRSLCNCSGPPWSLD